MRSYGVAGLMVIVAVHIDNRCIHLLLQFSVARVLWLGAKKRLLLWWPIMFDSVPFCS